MVEFALEIPPGIVLDDTSFLVAEQAWRDCDLVRFVRRRPQPIGGWETLQLDVLAGVCRNVLTWTDGVGGKIIAFGTNSHLYGNVGGELFDVTPEGLAAGAVDGTGGAGYGTGAYSVGGYSEPSTTDYFPRTWSLANWGASLMANPRGGGIYWSQDPATEAQPAGTGAPILANAPVRVTAMGVTETRQVVAWGCNEEISGDFNPMCIRHSDIEDPENWTTDSNNNVAEDILSGSGYIVTGRFMGDYELVWTDQKLYIGTFVGDPGQAWRYERVGAEEGNGLIGPNAVALMGSRAFWITPSGKLMSYAVGGEPTEVPTPVLKDVFDNLATSQADKISASTFANFQEVRFDYPDARDGLENSRYISFTMDGGGNPLSALAWARGRMARTAYTDAGPHGYPIGVDPAGVAYFHERGTSANGARFRVRLETADIYADNGRNGHVFLNMLTPDFKGQRCPVEITIKGRNFPQEEEDEDEPPEAVRVYGPFMSVPRVNRVPLRAEGRLVRVVFESYSADNFWRSGRHVFEVVPSTGGR